MSKNQEDRPLAQNKKAGFNYFIEETMEAGLVLTGTEIKSMRQGRCNLSDTYALIRNGEAFVINMHISPFDQGNRHNPEDPSRARKLLLHKKQIFYLMGVVKREGYSLVPLKSYVRNGYAKLLIGIAKGKKLHDKRDVMATRDANREIQRALRERQK